ncbi:embryoproteinsis-associated protein EMB8 [Tanacetum coccineum]
MAENRIGAEVVHGAEECHHYSIEFLAELGFPSGIFPLKDPLECGRVRETGFVWIKQKAPYEHLLKGVNTRASYASEITAKELELDNYKIRVFEPIDPFERGFTSKLTPNNKN